MSALPVSASESAVRAAIERLSRIQPGAYHVVSCYLKLEPRDKTRGKYLIKIKNRIREALTALQRQDLERALRAQVAADLERVQAYFGEPTRLPPARGVALFACGALDLFEALPLPHVHRSRLAVAPVPLVRELVALEEEFGTILVAACDRTSARFFAVTAYDVAELASLTADATRSGKIPRRATGEAGQHARGRIRRAQLPHADPRRAATALRPSRGPHLPGAYPAPARRTRRRGHRRGRSGGPAAPPHIPARSRARRRPLEPQACQRGRSAGSRAGLTRGARARLGACARGGRARGRRHGLGRERHRADPQGVAAGSGAHAARGRTGRRPPDRRCPRGCARPARSGGRRVRRASSPCGGRARRAAAVPPLMVAPKRPIRVLVAKPGLDGHDRGAKVVAAALRDAGMEVIYTGLHQTPEMIAQAAVQEDVDVVGLSILSGAHLTLFPRVKQLLVAAGREDVLVTGGGIIPPEDAAALTEQGIGRLFGPGTPTTELVKYIEEWAAEHVSA